MVQNGRDKFAAARALMVENDLRRRGVVDADVLKVMSEIAREEFVPAESRYQSYADGPLSIGLGQTISQPFIVGLMTQELKVDRNCEVLEIGTGSGYQTAILAKLAKKVYTIERFEELSNSAKGILGGMGLDNVEFSVGDGSFGWVGKKTFDRVMVTAAVPEFCEPLVEQLAEGGTIVAPVGGEIVQELIAAKKEKGKLVRKKICGCRFVKLIGEHSFSE